MTQYIVSARKYRPDTFETLIGQDNIAQTLKNSIVRGQLAHAYLFCGPRGVGKTSTARIFAKTINCSSPAENMEPCGKCESCLSFAEGRSYCIHELDAASNNGVDDIKALMDQVRIPPQVGKYSVYIIDEVHMLSQSAFNAFLKTLEEPPAHAIFILATTEKHKILPTILSRCQTYDFNRITVDNIVKNLRGIAAKENVTIDDESLHVIAVKADGAMRDALTIFDQTVAFCGTDVNYKDVLKNLNVLDFEYSFSLTDAFLRGDYSAALLMFDEILAKGFNALHFVSALSSHFRDLAVSRSAGLEALLEQPDSLKKRYKEQSERCSLKFLYDALAVTTACETGYKAAVNPRLHIEFALMRLSMMSGAPAQPAVSHPAAPPAARAASPAEPQPVVSAPAPAPVAQPVMQTAVPAASQPSAPAPSGTAPAGTETAAAQPAPQPEAVSEAPGASAPPAAAPATPASDSAGRQPAQAESASAETSPEPEKPVARRSRAKAGSPVLSVKSMAEKSKTESAAPEALSVDGTKLSDEEIMGRWQDLAGLYAEKQPRLAVGLSNAVLSMEERDGAKILVFKVMNVAQRDWIREKCLRDIEGNFRKLTGTDIKIDVDVVPDDEENSVRQAPYLNIEKAKDLIGRHEEVKNLVSDFGLDVK